MAMPVAFQPSFSAGEVAPAVYGRTDLAKYRVGAKTMRNFIVRPAGGAANRPGTMFVGKVRDSAKLPRLIPFQFNNVQTYILEFGDFYMRVVKDGAQVTETGKAITGATQTNPCVITCVGHGYSTNDDAFISGVGGMTKLNGRTFRITVVDADHFQLNGIDSTAYAAYTAGGTSARIYTVTTPWAWANLSLLKFTQSADTMTVCHPTYKSQYVTRTGHAAWTISDVAAGSTLSAPSNLALTVAVGGAIVAQYKVTAVNADGSEESDWAVSSVAANIQSITQANPAVVTTTAAHGLATGDEIRLSSQPTMIQINNRYFRINVLTGTTFELYTLDNANVDSTNYTAATVGGNVRKAFQKATTAAMSTTNYIDVSWSNVSGATKYNIYKQSNGTYGFIGTANQSPFRDTGINPDVTDAIAAPRDPFIDGNYPSCVCYHDQRQMFANSNAKTNGLWTSQAGNYNNFTVASPAKDSDAITRALVANKVQDIRHLVSANVLIAFTGTAEWKIWAGSQSDTLTPNDFNARIQTNSGCSHVPPISIDDSILYIQEHGQVVRDMRYDFANDTYGGTDLSVISEHLFEDMTILEWAWQQAPFKTVWSVRSDGTLLGLTYMKEQEVYAWHRHDTDGAFKSVASISEGTGNAVYFVVQRTINGQSVGYIERLATRSFATIADAWFVDCGLQYSGAPTTTISGLDHLEGKAVSVLADGSVAPPVTVANGQITLDRQASKVTVGLQYVSDLQTLPIDSNQNGSILGKQKRPAVIKTLVQKTRGLKVGVDATKLVEFKERTTEPWGSPIQPFTGIIEMPSNAGYSYDGSFMWRQDQPLPATILAVLPEIDIAA